MGIRKALKKYIKSLEFSLDRVEEDKIFAIENDEELDENWAASKQVALEEVLENLNELLNDNKKEYEVSAPNMDIFDSEIELPEASEMKDLVRDNLGSNYVTWKDYLIRSISDYANSGRTFLVMDEVPQNYIDLISQELWDKGYEVDYKDINSTEPTKLTVRWR